MVVVSPQPLRLGQLLEKLEAYSKCPSSLSGKIGVDVFFLTFGYEKWVKKTVEEERSCYYFLKIAKTP